MFERYTEKARRVIFFARYEASQFGSPAIESEHLLLGLIRQERAIFNLLLHDVLSDKSIRKEVESRSTIRERISTASDLPLSMESKRILACAAEEAEQLKHRHVNTVHLVLGILREENCLAATILREKGVIISAIREEIANWPADDVPPPQPSQPAASEMIVSDARTAERIAEAVWLSAYGGKTAGGHRAVEIVQSNVWKVTSGPLYAFISAVDGRVLAMGMNKTGSAGV